MPTIASGICFAWPSTVASLPGGGWSRKTTMDTYYPCGAATSGDAGSLGGAATHTHTSPSHTPTQNSHTHTVSAGASTGTVTGQGAGSVLEAGVSHTHASATSNSTTATNNGIAITVNANTSNDLPYVKVIFIESDGTPTGVPNGAIGYFDSDSLPASWTRVYGNTYLKGADASGDGGGTGGSATHGHTSPAHTHTQNSHTHSAAASAVNTGTADLFDDTTDTNTASPDGHTHSVTLSSKTATNQSVTTTIDDANHEPEWVKLNIIRNDSGAASLPNGIIGFWLSTNGSIPTDWARLTAADTRFVKGCNANGEALTTGGAQTHTHTASACQPIQDSHNHTTSIGVNPLASFQSGSGATSASRTHTHTWTIGSTTPTNNAATVTIDANTAKSAYPSFREVILIKYTSPGGPTVLPRKTLLGAGA